jgi:S1-C subfamily serine protease
VAKVERKFRAGGAFVAMALLAVLVGLVLTEPVAHSRRPEPTSPIEAALSATVLVDAAGTGFGTGVVVRNGERVLAWTCAHVVSDCAYVVEDDCGPIMLPDGNPLIFFNDVTVSQDVVVDGAKAAVRKARATVLRFSLKHDLAVLCVHDAPWLKAGARFASAGFVPRVGADIFHVGCLWGPIGPNSYSRGHIAAVGRLRENGSPNDSGVVFDQSALVALPGSSGGGVYRLDGVCIGLVSESLYSRSPQGAAVFIPARRIHEFARAGDGDCLWALGQGPVPRVVAGPVVRGPVAVEPAP